MDVRATKANAGDSFDIWTWRNDPQTRAMSITMDEVSWETHDVWFRESMANPDRFLYVGRMTATDDKVGVCRFDMNRDTAQVSINVNPLMRGRQLSHELLAAAIAAFWEERKCTLKATIKRRNAESIKCFTKCGFTLEREDHEYGYYSLAWPVHE